MIWRDRPCKAGKLWCGSLRFTAFLLYLWKLREGIVEREFSGHKALLLDFFKSALAAVDPYRSIAENLGYVEARYREGSCRDLLLVSFGKAAHPMAMAVADSLPHLLSKGTMITKYGHSWQKALPENVRVFEAGHPIPDNAGLSATRKVMESLNLSGENTLVLCLISGGGSALLVAPYGHITLAEKGETTDLLLKAGADIYELNTVRKHISAIKGGRLAAMARPARVISLILSDVVGDRLDMIASGPTAPDETTYQEALSVIERYSLLSRAPARVLETLRDGAAGLIPETLKKGSPVFEGVENIIVGSNRKATEAAAATATMRGYETTVLSSELQGEAADVASWLAQKAVTTRTSLGTRSGRRVCFVSGGETTVFVRGSGLGGRNTELALAFAMAIEGIDGITLLSAGTDGTDGPTDAAGALVDGSTIVRGRSKGLDPSSCLKNNDSYSFFKETGELVVTGPTGTNVMDLQIILIE
jgi:glycerate 2-kinase